MNNKDVQRFPPRRVNSEGSVRVIPSFSLTSVQSDIPMIRITDTDPVIPQTFREREFKPSLGAPLEEDGVRVILNNRRTEHISSLGSGGSGSGSGSDRSTSLNRQLSASAAAVPIIKGTKAKDVPWQLWRRKLYTVLWVNLLIRYRSKTITFLEIFLPVLVMFFFISSLTSNFAWTVGRRLKAEVAKEVAAGEPYKKMNEEALRKLFCTNIILCNGSKPFLAYTPTNWFTDEIMNRTVQKLRLTAGVLKPTKNEGELLEFCKENFNFDSDVENIDPVGVVFEGPFPEKVPRVFSYQIRTFTSDISNTAEIFPYIEAPVIDHPISPYIFSGFVGLQNAIDKSFVDMILNVRKNECHCNFPRVEGIQQDLETLVNPVDVEYNLQMFPFTLYLDLKARYFTWASIMVSIVLGYFCTSFFSVKQVIIDLNSGVLELLKLHGLVSYMYWISLLLHDVILRGLGCIFMTWIMFANVSINGGFFEYENPFLVWCFFFSHGIAKTAQGFFCAVFFSNPTAGGLYSFLISFLSFFIPINLYTSGQLSSTSLNCFLCLCLPNWCLANGLFHFLKFESFDSGVSWSSSMIWDEEQYVLIPIGICLLIFNLSTIIFMALTIYVDKVSLKYLSPKEDYMYFLKCKCRLPWKESQTIDFKTAIDSEFDDNFAKPKVYKGEETPCKVQCRNISHYYGDKHVALALHDVSLNFYEDQITVILGHSASGKSTLLHTLAGLLIPEIGTTRVLGVDPARNKQVRLYVGFCPQKLILFQTLSVVEHLRVACMLHCDTYKAAKKLSDSLLVRFNLFELQHVGVCSLSEAQKRKLAIAMALSTNPPVLILDEPTNGMDPAARFEIWTLLMFLRTSRTIILTTSTMDEADIYADKIVLLAKGKVLCFGPPGYLKNTYNAGSMLKLRKEREDDRTLAARVIELLYENIDQGVHEVQQKGLENQDRDIYISLPQDNKDHIFSKIIAVLEEKKQELGIAKISMTHATLGGIFFKLSNENGSSALAENRSDHSHRITIPIAIPSLPKGVEKDPNFLLTISALFAKQIMYIRQKHRMFLIEYIAPLVLAIFFIKFSETFVASQPGPTTRPLTPNTYSEPPIPILLQVNPNDHIVTWIAAFDGLVGRGKLHSRNRYFNSSKQDEQEFKKSLIPHEGSIVNFHEQVVTAFRRDTTSFVGLYASNALHSAPIVQNMLTNSILYLMSSTEDRRTDAYNPFRITISNKPIPVFKTLPTGTIRDATNALAGVVFGFLLGLIAASKITFCIIERTSGIKTLQLMTGVGTTSYWVVIFICDFVINFTLVLLIMAIVCVFDTSHVFRGQETKRKIRITTSNLMFTTVTIFILQLLYLCWASLPFGYIMSRLSDNPHNAFGQYVSFHILTGSLPEIAAYLLFRTEVESGNFFNILRFCLLVFPSYGVTAAFVHLCDEVSKRNFCLRMPVETVKICTFFESQNGTGISDLLIKSGDPKRFLLLEENDIFFHQCCQAFCKPRNNCFKATSFFEWEGSLDVASSALGLACQGLFYWIILMLVEYKTFSSIWIFLKAQISGDLEVTHTGPHVKIENETVGLHTERERINQIVEFDDPSTDVILVADVTKFFGKKKALEHIYFSAQPGTVVGILGLPQSGKSILLKLLSGELPSAIGTILINKIKLSDDPKKYHQNVAYCPQTNPILEYLTGFQMMQLMGRLRGIPADFLDILIRKWLELLGLDEEHWKKKCSVYPPGMRRRLTCAMTLIGSCDVLMFDEPTTGLDPLEHLTFWNILTFLQKQKQTILFTSSRAEECIQVTTKLIMIGNGQVLDVGTPEEIYERYANGWTLVIRYRHDIVQLDIDRVTGFIDRLHEYIVSVFSPCQLKDDQDNFLMYHVSESVKTLSYMYEHMESAKTQLPELIDDYYIAEANLDEVIGNLPKYSTLYHHGSGLQKGSYTSAAGSV